MKTNKIVLSRTETIDGEVYITNVREEDIRKKYNKDYFEMTPKQKSEYEKYFCGE